MILQLLNKPVLACLTAHSLIIYLLQAQNVKSVVTSAKYAKIAKYVQSVSLDILRVLNACFIVLMANMVIMIRKRVNHAMMSVHSALMMESTNVKNANQEISYKVHLA